MPFTNEIVAGSQGSLIRNSIQSPNFNAGLTGWIIRKDGSVEFNNGTFRGSLTSGPNPGKHITLNDALGTGDAIDVYNAANLIVFSVDNNGVLRSIDRGASGNTFALNAAGEVWNNNNTPAFVSAQTAYQILGGAFPKSVLSLLSGQVASTDSQASLDLVSGSGANAGSIHVLQRGINGHIIQTDSGGIGATPVNNLFHAAQYSVTYTAASFTQIFNHGCNFTPSFAICSFDDGSAINSAICHIAAGTITATQATLYTNYVPGLGSPALGDVVIIDVIFVA